MRTLSVLLVAALVACSSGGTESTPPPPPPPPPPPAGEELCATLAPLAAGTCEVTAGDASLLVRGTILTPGKIYRGGEVAIDATGVITCVGCGCAAGAPSATRITCPQGVVSPGLVNAHDHLAYAGAPPVADTGERYEHRHDWLRGLRGHTRILVPSTPSQDALRWAELRFVLGGATSTAGAAGAPGFLRNLDTLDRQEGLGLSPAHLETFPLDDATGTLSLTCSSYPGALTSSAIASYEAFLGHVSEGVDAYAANEFSCLSASNPPHDLVAVQSAFVQGVALRPEALAVMAAGGTALVWSPRSNVRLYGDTAAVTTAARAGVQLALGTDWLATGSMNVLRELACADDWNQARLDGFFGDEALWLMATRDAAEVLGAGSELGTLAAGRVADLAVFDASAHPDHRAVLDAAPADVALVVRGGKVLYGDAGIVAAVDGGDACDALDVCGAQKAVCAMRETGASLAALTAANATAYPLFACGAPPGEPTCVPARAASVDGSTVYAGAALAEDLDGDGIANGADACPRVFDPARPGSTLQADADGDGQGDACDPCPLQAGTTTCAAVDPRDVDADGRAVEVDNCPTAANADQLDADSDGKGDACDACPAVANPGAAPCPVTVYGIQSGAVAEGARVSVSGVVVTATSASGFFVQVPEGHPTYAGADLSGLFVAWAGGGVVAGDRVTVTSGTAGSFFGETRLTAEAVQVTASGEALPAPVLAAPADVATGGARAAALEGVLVRVEGVTVTDVGPGSELVVTGGLRVDDLLHVPSPLPSVGDAYASMTGVLVFRSAESRLAPRSAEDLVPVTP